MAHSKTYLERRVRLELTKAARQNPFLAIAEKRPGQFRMRCPVHSGGRERTPSLWVTINPASKYFFRFRCFGCPLRGQWPDLARLIRCDPIVTGSDKKPIEVYDESVAPVFDENSDKRLLGENITSLPQGLLWPDFTPWRTIKGSTIAGVNGLLFIDKHTDRDMLCLPVSNPEGELDGYVKANIIPTDGLNYINATGMSSTKSLMFADISSNMIRELHAIDHKQEFARLAFISEGPRDALNPLQYGYPSVGNLGAYNSWHKDKVNILLSIGIDLLIVCMDSDEAGDAATQAILSDTLDLLHVHVVTFPSEVVKKRGKDVRVKLIDLSDLSEAKIDKLVQEACKSYGKLPPPKYDWDTRAWM